MQSSASPQVHFCYQKAIDPLPSSASPALGPLPGSAGPALSFPAPTMGPTMG